MTQKLSKEIRIDALITAAVEEFLLKGYEGASVDAIAKRAGVSKGGFYHHFPNKEILLMEANRKLSEPVARMAENALSCVSALEGLSRYCKDYLKYWAARPKELSFFFLSMSKALESEILIDYYREYVKETAAFFVGLFQKAADMGEADISDPKAYGITFMGALDGVLSYIMINPNEDIDALAARMDKIWV